MGPRGHRGTVGGNGDAARCRTTYSPLPRERETGAPLEADVHALTFGFQAACAPVRLLVQPQVPEALRDRETGQDPLQRGDRARKAHAFFVVESELERASKVRRAHGDRLYRCDAALRFSVHVGHQVIDIVARGDPRDQLADARARQPNMMRAIQSVAAGHPGASPRTGTRGWPPSPSARTNLEKAYAASTGRATSDGMRARSATSARTANGTRS